ncbi:MAG: hypothetical protein N3F67_03065 [Acidilobaceae archaeon]|nr:hypothetical protein [Acidilobaceae archaeon]
MEGLEAKEGRERIARMLDVLPSASALAGEQKQLREKRVRLKFEEAVEKGHARISAKLARALGITDKLEVVVAGRTRLLLQAIIDESLEEERVFVNPSPLLEKGVADNSIVTVRAAR